MSNKKRRLDAKENGVENGQGDRILFAVPKKGRLYETCIELLNGSGLEYVRAPRLDIAQCTSLPVTLVFLPAADIAQYVGEGNVDMGITGKDIIGETGVEVKTLMPLDFGKCRLCVQAPIGTCTSAKDLCGKRIVTSYPNLTSAYFAKLDSEKESEKTKIKYVSGSVEAACGLGLADGIVDLVETGTTMQAAGLEVVDTVMDTETVLIANPKNIHEKLVSRIQKRIESYLIAKKYVLMTYNVEKKNLDKVTKITPGHESPTISALQDENWVAISVMVKAKEASLIMDQLIEVGGRSIVITQITNCRF